MKGTVYKITNKINNKVYIGKTHNTLEKRMKIHISDSKRQRCINRPLYKAFHEYGIENFSIEPLGEFQEPLLSEMEEKFIAEYNSFEDGYNGTLGGNGSKTFKISPKEVINSYSTLEDLKKVANKYGCDIYTIRNILIANNIKIEEVSSKNKRRYGTPVAKFTLDGEWIEDFNTLGEACDSLKDEKASSGSISRCCRGIRKTYKGFIWKYI